MTRRTGLTRGAPDTRFRSRRRSSAAPRAAAISVRSGDGQDRCGAGTIVTGKIAGDGFVEGGAVSARDAHAECGQPFGLNAKRVRVGLGPRQHAGVGVDFAHRSFEVARARAVYRSVGLQE